MTVIGSLDNHITFTISCRVLTSHDHHLQSFLPISSKNRLLGNWICLTTAQFRKCCGDLPQEYHKNHHKIKSKFWSQLWSYVEDYLYFPPHSHFSPTFWLIFKTGEKELSFIRLQLPPRKPYCFLRNNVLCKIFLCI